MTAPPPLDPQLLERLRRGVPLVLAPTGRFRFDGEEVTHPRVDAALRAGLDVSDDGDPIVHLGPQWCYLTVEDCPLRATAVGERDGSLWLRLNDGREVPLDRATLWEEPDRGLRAVAPSQPSRRPLAVRFTNAAQMQLSEWIEFEGDDAVLVHASVRSPVGTRDPLAPQG